MSRRGASWRLCCRGVGILSQEGTRIGRGAHFWGTIPLSSSSVVPALGELAQGKQQSQPELIQEVGWCQAQWGTHSHVTQTTRIEETYWSGSSWPPEQTSHSLLHGSVWLQPSYLTSLRFGFLTFKTEIMLPTSKHCGDWMRGLFSTHHSSWYMVTIVIIKCAHSTDIYWASSIHTRWWDYSREQNKVFAFIELTY